MTKRRRRIVRLAPLRASRPVRMPDFMRRLRAIYGEKLLPTSGAETVAQDRDRY